jgi:hypothetical protein
MNIYTSWMLFEDDNLGLEGNDELVACEVGILV